MVAAIKKAFENGAWRNWVLGIVATMIAAMIGNDITFQRDTRATLTKNDERLKVIETQRLAIAREQIVREFARHDQRMDGIVGAIANLDNTHPSNTEVGQQLHQRDVEIQRLEKRIEQLERR